jgi:hypothetical protein
MDEVETQSAMQETAQEVATPQTEATQETASEAQQEDRQDRNWRELRRSRDELDRQNRVKDEIIDRLTRQQPSQPQLPPEEDILSSIAQDEYVPGEKVAKGFRKLKEEFTKEVQEIKRHYQEKEKNALYNDLKREFPDFDEVVNPETLAVLEETNPRLAMTIASSKDAYSIALQSYEYIKAKGISTKPPSSKRAQELDQKLEHNKKTVQSPQAFDKRPMAAAFRMTDAMKKELQDEMLTYARQAGMGY